MFHSLLWGAVALLAQAQRALGQDGAGVPGASLFTSTTNIPFFAHGVCATRVDCGALGIVSVTTITTTIPGINPVESTVTITPTSVNPNPNAIHTVTLIPPLSEFARETVTVTVKPGDSYTQSFPSNPEPGSPATVVIYPGGPAPTSVHTVTSTLSSGHAGPSTITLTNEPPLAGKIPTVTVIPPVTSDLTVSICPPEKTVTIVQEPQPAPAVDVTDANGQVTQKPASRFPCSKDDSRPCRGFQVQPWTVFKCLFDSTHPFTGVNYPGPWTRSLDLPHDTILTVSDSWFQAEHWTVSLDGDVIGETHEDGFKNEHLSCSWDGDSCIEKGFSHGSFWIPKGKHELKIEWTDGPLKYNNGHSWWTHGYGVYRLDRPCKCSAHDEL